MDYKERIKEIIADTLGIDIERITDDLAAGDIEGVGFGRESDYYINY